jgi:hypothetical protein
VSRRLWTAGLLVLVSCAGILGLRATSERPFPHRRHLLGGVSCTTCHAGIERAGERGPLHLPDDETCLGCHAPPHTEGSCTGCHTDPTTAPSVAASREHLRFEHARHVGAVARGNCVRCHVGVAEGDDRMRPSMATCFRCHDHEGDQAARRCNACHVDLAEEGTLPATHLAHDGDFLREHGVRAASSGDLCQTCHKEQFCAGCHAAKAPMVPARLRVADPFSPGLHRAGFAARHALEAKSDPGACVTCHRPERCQACHSERGVATGGSPHPAGWVGLTSAENLHGRAARRDPLSCASCHGGAGEALCVGCHKVGGVGGSPHPPGWSSRQSFETLPCRLCHTGLGR